MKGFFMISKKVLFISLFIPYTVMGFSVQEWWQSFWAQRALETITKEYEIASDSSIIVEVYGNVTIKPFKSKKLIIEINGTYEELDETSLHTQIHAQRVTVEARPKNETEHHMNYTLLVPLTSHVTVKTKKGFINAEGLEGSLSPTAEDGDISVRNGIGTLKAVAPSGTITVDQKKLPAASQIMLDAGKGIVMHMSRTINAHIHARAPRGEIECNLHVTLDPITTMLNKKTWKKIMRDIKATLGTDGAMISLETLKGNIVISEL